MSHNWAAPRPPEVWAEPSATAAVAVCLLAPFTAAALVGNALPWGTLIEDASIVHNEQFIAQSLGFFHIVSSQQQRLTL